MKPSNNLKNKTLSKTYWVLRKVFSRQFYFIWCRRQHIRAIELWRYSIFTFAYLPLLLEIRQKSRDPSFWDLMHSFVLLAYASLAASRFLLEQLLAWLNFNIVSEDLFCCCKPKKSDFYELWQQCKQLKTIEISEALRIIYINSNLNPLKIH